MTEFGICVGVRAVLCSHPIVEGESIIIIEESITVEISQFLPICLFVHLFYSCYLFFFFLDCLFELSNTMLIFKDLFYSFNSLSFAIFTAGTVFIYTLKFVPCNNLK